MSDNDTLTNQCAVTNAGSYASEAGEEPNLLAKKKRGAKPKYKYGTEAEALAMRYTAHLTR